MPGYFYTWTGPNIDGKKKNCKLYKKSEPNNKFSYYLP